MGGQSHPDNMIGGDSPFILDANIGAIPRRKRAYTYHDVRISLGFTWSHSKDASLGPLWLLNSLSSRTVSNREETNNRTVDLSKPWTDALGCVDDWPTEPVPLVIGQKYLNMTSLSTLKTHLWCPTSFSMIL